jgi:hypothetical protein
MKKPKLVLDYFIRLIESGELESERSFFHGLHSGRFSLEPDQYIVREYDADKEVAVYEEMSAGYSYGKFRVDFSQKLNDEVVNNALKVKAVVFKKLSSGTHFDRELFFRQVITDIERLISRVAKEEVFVRYPFVATTLIDIKEFVVAYKPQQSEKGEDGELTAGVEGIGFHYRYLEEGTFEEDKAQTRIRLGELFYALRDQLKLIAPDTSIDDFRALFSGRAIKKPVMWIGANNQLRHFIKSIERKLIPLGHKKIPHKWETAAACFINRRGESFTASQLQITGSKVKDVPRIDQIEELSSILR